MKTKDETTALAVVDEQTAALAALGIVDGDQRGKESIEQEDKLPRFLKVSQKVSPELEPADAKYMDELKPNQLFLTGGSGPIFGASVEIIPVAIRKHAIQFADEKLNRSFERNVPWNDPRCEFQGDEKPEATRIYDIAVLIVEEKNRLTPAIMSMSVTNIKEARRFLGWLDDAPGPIFARRFKVSVTLVPYEKTYYGIFAIDTKNAQIVTPEQFAVASAANKSGATYLAKAKHTADGETVEGRIVGEDDDDDPM